MPSGYSKTPLAKKLGIKEGFNLFLHNAPEHYWSLFSDLPDNLTVIKALTSDDPVDFIHVFCTHWDDLIAVAPECKAALKKDGLMWISWPKGKSSIPSDLKRDPIREYLINLGLVDVKVAAVDEDWSGLKFVYRKKDR